MMMHVAVKQKVASQIVRLSVCGSTDRVLNRLHIVRQDDYRRYFRDDGEGFGWTQ